MQTGKIPAFALGCALVVCAFRLRDEARTGDAPVHSRWIGGIVATNIGTLDDTFRAILVQPDFKIVGVGQTRSASPDTALVRFHADGSLDSTFNGTGFVVTAVSTGEDWAHAVVRDSVGRILVAGRSFTAASSHDFTVIRYLSNGSLDTTFGTGGIQTIGMLGHEFARGLALTSDQKIIVAGYSRPIVGPMWEVAVARLDTNESLDASFGTGGKASTAPGASLSGFGYGVAVDSSDRVIVAGMQQDYFTGQQDVLVVRYGTDGSLDPGFDGDGMRTESVSAGSDVAWAVAVDAAGRIVVGGRASNGTNSDYLLIRYLTDGTPDAGFNGTGIRTDTVGAGDDVVRALSFDADGRLLAAGAAQNGASAEDYALGRYLTDGTLDTSFGSGGFQLVAVGTGSDTARAMAYFDQKTYVGGRIRRGGPYDMALVRYNSNGALASSASLDHHFNQTGFRTTDLLTSSIDTARDMVMDSEGRYVLVGSAGNDFAVARYLSTGALETSWTLDVGALTTDIGRGVALQTDGKIVVSGTSNNNYAVARFLTNGALDTTFNPSGSKPGTVTTNLDNVDNGYSVAIQPDGKIVVAGTADVGSGAAGGNTRSDAGIVRYLTNGALDTTFGTGGIVLTDYNNKNEDFLRSVIIDENGKVVVGGDIKGTDFLIARYTTTGALDTTFNATGFHIVNYGGGSDQGYRLLRQSDNKIYLLGEARRVGGFNNFTVNRFLTTGALDTTFGTNGTAEANFGSLSQGRGLALQPNGKIVMVGAVGTTMGLARLHSNGSLDTTFGTAGLRTMSLTTGVNELRDVIVLPDSRIIAAGAANQNFAIMQLWP